MDAYRDFYRLISMSGFGVTKSTSYMAFRLNL